MAETKAKTAGTKGAGSAIEKQRAAYAAWLVANKRADDPDARRDFTGHSAT